MLWNPTGPYSSFNTNITGIGRDDNSALDQRKSKSENADSKVIIEKTSSFPGDINFIIWGSNNQTVDFNNSDAPTGFFRPNRLWKTHITGAPGTVNVSIVLGGNMTNTGNVSDYALLIDGDLTFSNATAHTSGATLNGDTLSFTNVSMSHGDHFTIGSKAVTAGPGSITSGLAIWLKANNGVVGTSAVSQWNNSYTTTNNYTQSNAN